MPTNRPYAHMTDEELIRTRDNPDNRGCQPQTLSIIEIEFRASQKTMQSIQADIQKLTKPHWTLTPTFWLVILTALVVPFQLWQYVAPVLKSLNQTAPSIQSSSHLQSIGTNTTKTSQPKHVQKKP